MPLVHPQLERAAAYSGRILVCGLLAVAVIWLIGQLWVVFTALFAAALLVRILAPATHVLTARSWRPSLAAATVLVGFMVALTLVMGTIGFATADKVNGIGTTVSQAMDDIEDWLVKDAPIDVTRKDVARYRANGRDAIENAMRTSEGSVVAGATLAAEVMVSLFLALIITFFTLKDGDRFLKWSQSMVPADRRVLSARLANRAWITIGGYLRGAALLGAVEAAIMGVTMALVGAELAVPVAVLTFLLAFIPFAGAIVAGALAVLITLATGGSTAALIVLVVAVVVQQLDGDVLAPVVYGSALQIHPVVILLAIASGGALFGFAGTVLAVPVVAVGINLIAEARIVAREQPHDAAAARPSSTA